VESLLRVSVNFFDLADWSVCTHGKNGPTVSRFARHFPFPETHTSGSLRHDGERPSDAPHEYAYPLQSDSLGSSRCLTAAP